MIDVGLLGCGGMMPLPDRRLTALLIRHRGRMTLIDCGEGTQVGIKLLGWGFKGIDTICFTHYHADHVLGLVGLLLTIGNSGRVDPLVIMGPPPLQHVVSGLRVIAPELPYELELVELSTDEMTTQTIGPLKFTSMPAEHTIPCLAYAISLERPGQFDQEKARLNGVPMSLWKGLQKGETLSFEGQTFTPDMVLGESRRGIKVSYCTDSRPTREIRDLAKDADLFICEGMYGDPENQVKALDKKHMTFTEAANLAKDAAVCELWLTHFSPALKNANDFIGGVQEIFPNTVVGQDLLVKSIGFR